MAQSDIPPCPDELLRRLREPITFALARESPPSPGTVWEVRAPDGELLVFLVVRRFDADEAAPFSFVRAVPLSDFVGLTDADDAIVAVESSATILAAHCWLEGPVRPEMLVRCVGLLSPTSMDAVEKAREQQRPAHIDATVAAFRESLYDQFDPVFNVLAMGLNPSPSGETLRFFGSL